MMKKQYYLVVLISLLTLVGYSQSQRLVLVEEATNASCGPCASQNPAFDALLQNNLDKVVALKYHWYFPGYDPMHNHNTVENNARVSYYGINGVPHALLDGSSILGSSYTGAPANCTQAKIDAAYAVPSPFEISMSHEVSNGVINVAMLLEATGDVSGNLRARIAVVEKLIDFTSPPGNNGESEFHDVMKKMLPNQGGVYLNNNIEAGEYFILEESWELANVYDEDELGVVGFIQDHTSKVVYQAGDSGLEPLIPLYSNDGEIYKVENISPVNCLGSVSPVITIRNNGSQNLTSLTIKYSVNGGAEQTQQWSGNLDFLEKEVITLEAISFELQDENNLTVYSENTNGVGDDYAANDIYIKPFEEAIHISDELRVVIITDQNPEETTWEIINSTGEVVLEGGPYTEASTLHQEYYDIPIADCYRFIIHDAGNNGLCCEYGNGAWGIYDADGNIEIETGGIFTDKDSVNFERGGFTGSYENKISKSDISIYPNPSKENTNISFTLNQDEQVSYSLVNILGEIVLEKNLGIEGPGRKSYKIESTGFKSGIYYFTLKIGESVITEKLIISK